eukprot:5689597-Pleurochrysis_carterae.AAC.1
MKCRPDEHASLHSDPALAKRIVVQVARMTACRERARSLSPAELSEDWIDVRRKLLWAAGLRDITDAPPGMGYTGHAFNDDNHCDATCMLGEVRGVHGRPCYAVKRPLAKRACATRVHCTLMRRVHCRAVPESSSPVRSLDHV